MEENRNDQYINELEQNVSSDTNSKPMEKENGEGYTVTPEGGFYTKAKNDIIQDEPPAQRETVYSQPQQSYTAPSQEAQSRFNNSYSYPYQSGNNQSFTPPVYQQPKPKKERKRHSSGIVLLASLLAAVIGAVGGAAAAIAVKGDDKPSTQILTSDKGGTNVNITVDETAANVVEAVAQKASNSVVGIRTTTYVNNFFFGSSESTGSGSGVVYTSDGYIITNYHVIESVVQSTSKASIEVFIGATDETAYEAQVVGYSISSDLAVLKIDAKGLTPIEIGDAKELKVGQFVITIGSPGGLEFRGSVTYGVISGLNRVVSSDSEVKLIQTDAAINPGNSGGALLDTSGKLVGINSSKIVSTEYEGMGFSIPIDTVVEKCDKIITRQNEPEPYIGISISKKYTEEVLSYYGFPNGAVVQSVDNDSPADDAGIQRGDIITELDGNAVKSASLFEEYINECEPGSTVKVKLYRSGRYYSTEMKIVSNS